MQDELARVSEQLELLCLQRREEASKQAQNGRLLDILDEDVRRMAADKQRLLEGQATGQQSFLLACHAVLEKTDCWCLGAKGGCLEA